MWDVSRAWASGAGWVLGGGPTARPTEAEASGPTEGWRIRRYVAVDTWWPREGRWQVPPRLGPPLTFSDQELGTLALARGVPERRRERAWRAEVLAAWGPLFPTVPKQAEWNRRTRERWGARGWRRTSWVRPGPRAPGGWEATDPAPWPIKHPRRVRGGPSGDRDGPGNDLVPRGGCCSALARWGSGFRRALRTGLAGGLIRGWALRAGLADGLIRGWALVPAAGDERRAADGLLNGEDAIPLLTDQGLRCAASARTWAAENNVHLRLAPSCCSPRAARRAPPRPGPPPGRSSSPPSAAGSRPRTTRSRPARIWRPSWPANPGACSPARRPRSPPTRSPTSGPSTSSPSEQPPSRA